MPIISRPGEGHLRRMIDLRCLSSHEAEAWLEDDFHHFGVRFKHDGERIHAVTTYAERYPWATCPGAAEPMQALVGKPLVARASDIGRLIDMRLQCTHVFDLAGLLSAFVTTGKSSRRYEVQVMDRACLSSSKEWLNPVFGEGNATLIRDGAVVAAWQLDNDQVTATNAPSGLTLGIGFRTWTESLPLDQAEYAFILRRAILVAGGRSVDHDQFTDASAMQMPALCHSFQPGVRERGLRRYGSTIDYSESGDRMPSRVKTL